jgi:hypothetical protein
MGTGTLASSATIAQARRIRSTGPFSFLSRAKLHFVSHLRKNYQAEVFDMVYGQIVAGE